MTNLAIVVSGGGNLANQALVNAVKEESLKLPETKINRVITSKEGFRGLFDLAVKDITHVTIDPKEAAYIFRISRTPPVYRDDHHYFDLEGTEPEEDIYEMNHKRAEMLAHNLERIEADKLVVIGGDGTHRALKQLENIWREMNHKIDTISIPCSMDNDMMTKTHHGNIDTVVNAGYPSTYAKMKDLAARTRPTIESQSKIHFDETLGRGVGFVAAASQAGGSHVVLLPEIARQYQEGKVEVEGKIVKNLNEVLLDRVVKFFDIYRYCHVVVSEGTPIFNEKDNNYEIVTDNAVGTRRLGGVGRRYLNVVMPKLKQRYIKPAFGYEHSNYEGKKPDSNRVGAIPYDLRLCSLLGAKVAEMIRDGEFNKFPALNNVVLYADLQPEEIKTVGFDEILEFGVPMPDKYFDAKKLKVTEAFEEFGERITSGPR